MVSSLSMFMFWNLFFKSLFWVRPYSHTYLLVCQNTDFFIFNGVITDMRLSFTESCMIIFLFTWFFLLFTLSALVVASSTIEVTKESRSCSSRMFNTLSLQVLKFGVPSRWSSSRIEIDVMVAIFFSSIQDVQMLRFMYKTNSSMPYYLIPCECLRKIGVVWTLKFLWDNVSILWKFKSST